MQRLRVSPFALRAVWVPAGAIVLLSPTASYVVRTITALSAAAVLLATAARRRDDELRLARRLIAAALLVGSSAGVVSAIYVLVTGHDAAIGWISDWLYLSYAPLCVAAALAVPRATKQPGGRARALADGAVAATSLWYLVVAFFVGPAHLGATLGPLARLVTLGYPLLPTFAIAVMLSALPRVTRANRPFLLRVGAGLTFIGVSDIGLAIASWDGWYRSDSWIAVINEFGLLLLLDAALLSRRRPRAKAGRETSAEIDATTGFLVVAAPHIPLFVALAAMALQFVRGEGLSHAELAPVALGGLGLAVRQIASARETGRLVARLAARERLARARAMTDPLTKLANRTEFLARLNAALRDREAHQVAVALLDLNDFKDINDTHGHDTGDQVLCRVGDLLRKALADDGACVARFGGDEFAVFVRNTSDRGQGLARTLKAAFAEPVQVDTRSFHIRPSIGVVIDERAKWTSQPGEAARLVAHADVAMYEAKRAKHVHDVPVAVLTGATRTAATATIRIREEIGHPDLSQFHVVYQPVVDLESGAIVATEALLRWEHPEFGAISPTTFIPLAERVGTVGLLGEYVLSVALDDMVTWTAARPSSGFTVGVNVSPRQLVDQHLVTTALSMLHERGLAPRQLSFELTEEAFADDVEAVVDTIAAMRAAGFWVAVDDFGTGYSSLSYLRRFDANVLKIDREFVQASETEPRTDALVRSVVAMASALDLICLAEGIETLEQLARVRSYGCRYGQGFALARPMPAAELGKLLMAGHCYQVDPYSLAVRPA